MQERGQKYIWGFWIISFVITSIFYMGCSGEKPFGKITQNNPLWGQIHSGFSGQKIKDYLIAYAFLATLT